MHKTDAANNVANEFSDGTPPLTPGTSLGAKWHNSVQRELVKVIEEAGLTLSDADDTQLWQAIRNPPSWTAATVLSPWTASSHVPSYRFEGTNKRVFLKGTLDATITGSGDWDFWNVPTGYRPPYDLYLTAATYDSTAATYQNCVVHLGLSGTPFMELFSVNGASPVTGHAYTLYLDGVSWCID